LCCAHARRALIAILVVALFSTMPAAADTAVAGRVIDLATGAPIPGAKIVASQAGATLASQVTGAEGKYLLTFRVGARAESQVVTLQVERADYLPQAADVVVLPSGAALRPSYQFELLSASLADCYQPRDHLVIVGYFRPPASSAADAQFAARIRDNVHGTLLPALQQLDAFKNQPALQPVARECSNARPREETHYSGYAKALGADAFLTGYVAPSGQLFKVEMWVADRYELRVPPLRATSANMNLDDPDATRLNAASGTAILHALAVGYEKAGQLAECVQVADAAKKVLRTVPAEIAATRARCQSALAHQGLLRGASQ